MASDRLADAAAGADSGAVIELRGLRLSGRVGVGDAELEVERTIVVDLLLRPEYCGALVSDAIAETVDYARVAASASEVAAARPYRTIEHLAATIADALLARFALGELEIRLAKPDPPMPETVVDVAVRLRRGRTAPSRICRGYLGFGSNCGDRAGEIKAGLAALATRGVRVVALSDAYETEPVGENLDQPDFLNLCARIETELDPLALLGACKAIEVERGRDLAAARHSPRPLDIDLLLLDGVEFSHPRLTLPHPETKNRRFVIVALLDLDPDLALPDGTRLAARLEGLAPSRVTAVGPLR